MSEDSSADGDTASGPTTGATDTADPAGELERLRVENAALKEQLSVAPAAAESKATPGYRRRWLSITSAVLAAVFVVAAVSTVWIRQTLLDTENYVETVAPLADDADIQEAVTFRVTETVAEAADFESLAKEALPEQANVLAVPIASGAQSLISNVVGEVVASDEFSQVWEDANRIAHENVTFVLSGESDEVIDTEDGKVTLKLGGLAEEVLDRLGELLDTDIFEQIPAEALTAEIILMESEALADVQGALGTFHNVSWLTPVLALLFLAGTVFFAVNRRLGVRRLGLAIGIPIFLAILFYGWARDQYLAALPDDIYSPEAAAAFFDITTRFLIRALRAMLIVGVLALVAAWAVGPSRAAAKVRGWWDALLGRAGEAGEARDVGPVPSWVAANERALFIGIGTAAVLALVLWTKPTGLVVLGLFVLAGVLMGLVRIVAEVARRSEETTDDSGAVDVSTRSGDDSESKDNGGGDDGTADAAGEGESEETTPASA